MHRQNPYAAPAHRSWLSPASKPLWVQFGVCGLLVWAVLLGCAFYSYPRLDNPLVGWPVYAFEGVAALGALRRQPMKFGLLLLGETAVIAIVFATVGAIFQALVDSRRDQA
jgi:hypothetical protein